MEQITGLRLLWVHLLLVTLHSVCLGKMSLKSNLLEMFYQLNVLLSVRVGK